MDLRDVDGNVVKIGSKKYVIKVKKKIKKGRLWGQSKHHKGVIELSLAQTPVSFADTLLHEILHCIWDSNGIYYALDADEVEEFVVNSYASSLMAIFTDNPWILKFIDDTIKNSV